MLQAKPITKTSDDFHIVNDLFLSAFPKAEQAPMSFLLQRAKKENIDFTAYYDNDIFAGFSYTVTQKDLTYVLYLAVSANSRSKGYGTQIMSHIKSLNPNNRIILNIEAQDETAENNEQRKRRKIFYERIGYTPAGFSLKMNGILYDVLINGGDCSADEFMALFKKYMGTIVFFLYRPKIIMG